jgi:hypothetical protein
VKKILVACVATVLAVALMGCQGKPATVPSPAKTVEASPSARTESQPKSRLTSDEIVAAFKTAGLPIGKVEVYDAETDTNKLLGRPGQYVAKFNFADTRLEQPEGDLAGGSVESFSTEKDLNNRAQYIKSIGESMPLLVEYEYTNGFMLLRLRGGLTPKQAEEYNTIFQKLGK